MTPSGETDLKQLLRALEPKHNPGDYVFCVVDDLSKVDPKAIIMLFREKEGHTIILRKELADRLNLSYSFTAGWITLGVHSSLAAVGLTASFSQALSQRGISCNVVAAYYHDHIFVDKKDTEEALNILSRLSR